MAKNWSYSTGHRGMNRVRVYERRTTGVEGIWIEWREGDKRVQRSLRSLVGHAVTDRSLAVDIANELAKAREVLSNKRARQAVFGKKQEEHTIGELFTELWRLKADGWRHGYHKNQITARRFWEDQLGLSRPCQPLSAAEVETIVARAAADRGWKPGTQGRYLGFLVDAYEFGRTKLKWWGEEGTLSAVDMPEHEPESRPYTDLEARQIIDALREIDVRAWCAAEVAYATGRRINSIRTLTRDLVHEVGGMTAIRFPGKTDKARRTGIAVLTKQAAEAVQAALKLGSEWLLPNERQSAPVRYEWLVEQLREAETRAGVRTVPGRAYHGFKRSFATTVPGEFRRAASKQSGTTEQTLRLHYEQDDMGDKIALAKYLEARRGG